MVSNGQKLEALKSIFKNTFIILKFPYLIAPFIVLGIFRYFFDILFKEQIVSFLPIVFVMYVIYGFVGFLFIFEKKRRIITILLLIINIVTFSKIFYAIPKVYWVEKSNNQTEKVIKVMSVNLWWKNENYEAIEESFKEKDVDVLQLIEFTDLHYRYLKNYLNESYPYSNLVFEDMDKPFAGNVTFSKYPIIESSSEIMKGYYSGYVKTEIEIDEKIYKFYLVHTTAPTTKEYFESRNKQLETISHDIDKDQKTVVCGDFNLSPWSYYYEKFEYEIGENFKNITLIEPITFTWQSLRFPFLITHIDHTFVSNDIKYQNIVIEKFPGSDHKSIYFEIQYE